MENKPTLNQADNTKEAVVLPTHKPNSKRRFKVAFLLALLFCISIVGSTFGVYTWQHNKLDTSLAENTNLKKQSDTLKDQLETSQQGYDSVSKKLNAALKAKENKSVVTPQTQAASPALDIQIISTARFNAQGGEDTPNNGVAVEVSLRNTTNSPIAFDIFDTSLQDNQSQVYQILYSYSGVYYPKNYVPLTSQTIQPGATVKGAMTYGVKNTDLNNFKLLYDAQTLSLKVL